MVTSPESATDRRVRRTRRALQEALLSLMAEKGYDEVTVADLIERADVGRSTFYNHYADKADLLDDCLDGLRAMIGPGPAPDAGPGAPDRLLGFSLPFLRHAGEQRPLARAMTDRAKATPLLGHVERVIVEAIRAELPSGTAGPVPVEAVLHYVAGTFLALLTWWLNDEKTHHTPEQIDQIFRALVTPGLRAVIG